MKKIFNCKQCHKDFTKTGVHKNWVPKFCSSKCYGLSIAQFKKCLNCNVNFYNYQNDFFCCMKCSGEYKRGKKFSIEHRKSLSLARKGRFSFQDSPLWKGDDVSYGTLHQWVHKKMGTPMVCEKCGISKKNNRQIHWANKSKKYKRIESDWIRLCVSCHKKFDLNRIKKYGDKLRCKNLNGTQRRSRLRILSHGKKIQEKLVINKEMT